MYTCHANILYYHQLPPSKDTTKKKKKKYLQVLNPRCVPSQRHEPSHDKLRRALGWRLPCWTPVSTNVQRLKIFQGTTRAPCKHKQFSTGCLTLDLQAFKPIASLTLIHFIITAYHSNNLFSAVYAFCPNLFLDVSAAGKIPLRLSGETVSHLQFAEDTLVKAASQKFNMLHSCQIIPFELYFFLTLKTLTCFMFLHIVL